MSEGMIKVMISFTTSFKDLPTVLQRITDLGVHLDENFARGHKAACMNPTSQRWVTRGTIKDIVTVPELRAMGYQITIEKDSFLTA